MPIPPVKSGEQRNDYVNRCMTAIGKEYDDNKQAVAVCERTWDDRNKKKSQSALPAETGWLRAGFAMHDGIGVDRERGVIRGMVVAQSGPFKSKGRGEFDDVSLKQIKALAGKNPLGLKSRLAHPTLSSDGIGKFLGRVKDIRHDSVRVLRDGKPTVIPAVRGDLHLDSTALDEPVGGGKPLGQYVMDLADSDPDALSSSLVLEADQELRLDAKKRPMLDCKGNELAPLWRPTALHASDVVDTGEAVDGLLATALSIEGLPDELVRQASDVLNKAFPGAAREVVEARCQNWLKSYLAYRFGDEPQTQTLNDSTFQVGDTVEWWEVDDDAMCECSKQGTIYQIATEGSLALPNHPDTEESAPCALVARDPDEDGDVDEWCLVALDELSLSDGSDLEQHDEMSASNGLSKSVADMHIMLARNGSVK